jgi:phenylacetate-CoA ligase
MRSSYETVGNYLNGIRLLRRLFRDQWLPRERIEEVQNIKLQKLLRHTYQNVPYYRRLMDRVRVKPEEIVTGKDLERIPITTKNDLRGMPVQDITASGSDLNSCWPRATSGSTGVPLTVYRDNYSTLTFFGLNVRALRSVGARPTDKILSMGPTYYPTDLFIQNLNIGRVKMISPLKKPGELVDEMNSYKPDILHCYPSVLKSIISYLKKTGKKVSRPRIIVCIAEFLDVRTRSDAVEYFGCRPFQLYGSVEIGRVGAECSQGNGIHIYSDFVIPEFIPSERVNDLAGYRLILTSLSNFTMPFIRYDQGDLVRVQDEPCACGRSFTKIEILDSRDSDVLCLPNGDMVSALHLTGIIYNLPGIYQFKIVQEAVNRIVIKIIRTAEYSEQLSEEAVRRIEALLPGVHTILEIVTEIEREKSGKLRQFQSCVMNYNMAG